jgi:SNW domain-containing protein 1
MSLLHSLLPQPQHEQIIEKQTEQICYPTHKSRSLPPYSQRTSPFPFVPTELNDFNDGGAYPEIHSTQYPLNLGRKTVTGRAINGETTQLVSRTADVQLDAR